MKKILSGILLLTGLITVSSCKTTQAPQSTSTPKEITGIYRATIPCADCPGIIQTIVLQENKLFHLEQRYLERGVKAFKTDGVWKEKDGQILLYDEAAILLRLKPTAAGLVQLDQSGQEITGSLAKMYVHMPESEKNDNMPVFQQKRKAGTTFVALGTEPFWNIDVVPAKGFVFTQMGKDTIVFPFMPAKLEEGSINFSSKKDDHTLHLKAWSQYESDNMSEGLYKYATEAIVDGVTLRGVGVQLAASSALMGNWKLVKLHTTTTDLKQLFPDRTPEMNFDILSNRVSGSGGCNRFNGSFNSESNQINFSPNMAMTLMACPGEGEPQFMKAMAAVNTWEIKDKQLILSDKGKPIMTLQR